MTDVFRKEYKPLNSSKKHHVDLIKTYAEDLLKKFDQSNELGDVDQRMMALAKTNLEQAVMWAIKAIT